MKDNTYIYTFKTAKQKKDFKILVSKHGTTMQDEITEALIIRHPKLFTPSQTDKQK